MGRPDPSRTRPLRPRGGARAFVACVVAVVFGIVGVALRPPDRVEPAAVVTAPPADVDDVPPNTVGALLAAARSEEENGVALDRRASAVEPPPQTTASAPTEREAAPAPGAATVAHDPSSPERASTSADREQAARDRASEPPASERVDTARDDARAGMDADLADTIARSRQRRAERTARATEAVAARAPVSSGSDDARDAPIARAPIPERDVETVPDVTGSWDLTNAIAVTAYSSFAGLRITFRLELTQDGERIVGHGSKWAVDGVVLPPRQRTPIALAGRIRDRDVLVRFVERGTRRISDGGFRWRLSRDGGRLRGEFESSAAATRGTSVAERTS